jgi:hypothetical protein
MLVLLRPALIAPLLLLAGLVFGACTVSRGAHARFEAERARVDAACRAYRAARPDANVCRDDPYARRVIPAYQQGRARLADARHRLDAGDTDAAAAVLRHVFDDATRMDGSGTFIASCASASLVNEGLDLLERAPLGPDDRREIASHALLRSAAHPYEGERLTHLWLLSREDFLPRGPIGEALLADAMLEEDVVLAEMDRAVLAGDVGRCERAALGRRGLRATQGITLCEKAAEVARTGKRLQATRATRAR